ncbi:hypothetical protein OEZ49_22935 [Ruegeria sp. WL0004]|uniref:Transposase n=1 Tax=Ruegeria marisflavi TaxID=2984152 RepID=A0ABT2X3E2_9RHOB|nr:hypothetical protein [Ruegeria sp. WL0004]MCU9840598.1 hypothetical protein [Ruegeria sp. WL0004]
MIGCGRDKLRCWVQREEADAGRWDGGTSEERSQFKELEREVRELRQVNQVVKKASAYFAQAGSTAN